jgi:hypothetical protein
MHGLIFLQFQKFVHLSAQVVRRRRPQPVPGSLQQLPRFVKVKPFAKTHGLSHSRADLAAQLTSVGPLLHKP